MPRLILTFCVLLSTAGCTTLDIADTCEFTSGVHFYTAQPHDLAVLLVTPNSIDAELPHLLLGESDDLPVTIALKAAEKPQDHSYALSDTLCKSTQVHEFDLLVEESEWTNYWSKAKEQGHYSMAFNFPEGDSSVPKNSFGFTIIDKSTAQLSNRCGCFGK